MPISADYSKPISMLKDKSPKVFEGGMNLDSALHSVSEAAYTLGCESTTLPDSVFRNLSAARNAIEQAMEGLESAPDKQVLFDLGPAMRDAMVHERLMAETNQHNLRITQQANAMVNEIVDSLTAMFAANNLNISVARKYHANEGDNYYHVHTIEGVCRNNFCAEIVRVMISGRKRYELGNGRVAARHTEVKIVMNNRTYSSLNECLADRETTLTTLIIESNK